MPNEPIPVLANGNPRAMRPKLPPRAVHRACVRALRERRMRFEARGGVRSPARVWVGPEGDVQERLALVRSRRPLLGRPIVPQPSFLPPEDSHEPFPKL